MRIMAEEFNISVIIPVRNAAVSLRRCLKSILSSDYKSYEIIVVDDHSVDESVKIAGDFPCRVIIAGSRTGAAVSRNRGAQKAVGEILVFIDADVFVEKNTLGKIARTFMHNPQISAVIGSYARETICKNFFSVYKNLISYYTHQTSSKDAFLFWSGCGAVRKDAFRQVGGFDESFSKTSVEDIELGYRLVDAGHRIYLNKKIQVIHHKSYNLLTLVASDLFSRAVPWTKLILKHKKFTNDQDTRINNIISVCMSYLMVVQVAFFIFGIIPLKVFFSAMILTVPSFFIANAILFRFIVRKKGLLFVIGFIPMNYFTNLYSGFGFILGGIDYISSRMLK
ncbi:MAG: glycosyltransferase [Elusimicrobiota bacterium]